MANVEKDFVVVKDAVQGAGAATFWSLNGDLNLEALTQEWLANNLNIDWLLEKPSAEVAFSRAQREMETTEMSFSTVKTTDEVVLTHTHIENDFPQYTHLAKWKLENKKPVLTYAIDPDTGAALHQTLLDLFKVECERITSTDVSKWLRWLVEGPLHGVALREHGGFYFVPPYNVATWRDIKMVVTQVSEHKLYNLPMMKSDDAIETIFDAMLSEARQTVDRLQEVLEQNANGNGNKGDRGLNTQAEKAATLKAKLVEYSTFLGTRMPDMEQKLEELKAGLFQAAAQAKAKKEAA